MNKAKSNIRTVILVLFFCSLSQSTRAMQKIQSEIYLHIYIKSTHETQFMLFKRNKNKTNQVQVLSQIYTLCEKCNDATQTISTQVKRFKVNHEHETGLRKK